MSEESEVLVELVEKARSVISDEARIGEATREIAKMIRQLTTVSDALQPRWLDKNGDIMIETEDADGDSYYDTSYVWVHPAIIRKWLFNPEACEREIDSALRRLREHATEMAELRRRAEAVLEVLKAMLQLQGEEK